MKKLIFGAKIQIISNYNLLGTLSHCLKITQNVTFELSYFNIFHQLELNCLVALFDMFQKLAITDYFWHF